MPRVPLRGRRSARAKRRADEETRAHVAGAASAAAAEVAAPTAVTPDLTAAAFFDVDNTMMMGASLFWFARGLAARKYFTTRDMAGFVWQQAKFRIAGRGQRRRRPRDPRERAGLRGRPAGRGDRAGQRGDLRRAHGRPHLGRHAALAQQHLDAGQRVWLVTATPVELASIIAHRLGLTGALGTVAEVVDGEYTGRLVGELMHGPAKAEAVLALAEREGLDLARCTAYSHSSNDLPMLSLTGTAVAVNPDTGSGPSPARAAGPSATSGPAARPPRSASRRSQRRPWRRPRRRRRRLRRREKFPC